MKSSIKTNRLCGLIGLLLAIGITAIFLPKPFTRNVYADSAASAVPTEREERIYAYADGNDSFNTDSIIVVLDKSVSGINKVHAADTFGTFGKKSIKI